MFNEKCVKLSSEIIDTEEDFLYMCNIEINPNCEIYCKKYLETLSKI